jgi:hypothetical protein
MTPAERAQDLADKEYWAPLDAWYREIAAVEKAIAEAEAAMRERCAKIADDYSAGFEAVRAAEGAGWCPKCGENARDVADDISRAIREGK